jgi:DNA-directed RNA polymerase subunit E'/Rpb7
MSETTINQTNMDINTPPVGTPPVGTPPVEPKEKKIEKVKTKKEKLGIYMKNVLTRKISLSYNDIGSNIKEILQNILSNNLEGKCSVEGYIRENTINIKNYSSGIVKGENILFDVMFECLVCNPPEGMTFIVKATNITKAGIRCVYITKESSISPVDVFIARDHNYSNELFSKIKVGDRIVIRVLGQRFEVNDKQVSVIGELIKKA